jgi:hypothetical protein
MAEITKNFTYDIPDAYLSQTNSNGDTTTASYTGPDRLYVYVDATSGRNTLSQNPPDEDFHYNPTTDTTPEGERLVILDCAGEDTTMCAIFLPHTVTLTQSDVLTALPEGYGNYATNWPPYPDHAYERDICEHDEGTGNWTLTWKQPWQTWATLTQLRNDRLDATDHRVAADMPDSIKNPWIAFRTKLRELPVTYGRGTASEIPAHMVKFPEEPTVGGYADAPADDGVGIG